MNKNEGLVLFSVSQIPYLPPTWYILSTVFHIFPSYNHNFTWWFTAFLMTFSFFSRCEVDNQLVHSFSLEVVRIEWVSVISSPLLSPPLLSFNRLNRSLIIPHITRNDVPIRAIQSFSRENSAIFLPNKALERVREDDKHDSYQLMISLETHYRGTKRVSNICLCWRNNVY